MCFSTSTTAAADDDGRATPIYDIHPDIVQSHILNRLDGPTLAATGSASSHFLYLCSHDPLWQKICHSTWPSTAHPAVRDAIADFPYGHRSFYSDSFPSVRCHRPEPPNSTGFPATTELISAVDVYFDGGLLYSKVLRTETLSDWFRCSPLTIDLLDRDETVAAPLRFDGDESACIERAAESLRVSWILIDPVKKRAVNVAGERSVEARWRWLTDDVQFRFDTVVGAGDGETVQCGVVVTCAGKEGGDLTVREVSMQVEDMEDRVLAGLDSLVIIDRVMEGQRCKIDTDRDRREYDAFKRAKVRLRERKEAAERRMDSACLAAGVSTFAIFVFFGWRLIFV